NGPIPVPIRQGTSSRGAPIFERPGAGRSNGPNKTNSDPDQVATQLEIGQLRRFNELMLRYLPLGVAGSDRAYRILTRNGAARRLLGIRDGAIDQDFLHSVRGLPYSQVRAAIDLVFREHTTSMLPELEMEPGVGGNARYLTLTIMPMQIEPGGPDMAMVSV